MQLPWAVLSVPRKREGAAVEDIFIFAVIVVLEVLVAYGFWWLFENRTSVVKDWIFKIIGLKDA